MSDDEQAADAVAVEEEANREKARRLRKRIAPTAAPPPPPSSAAALVDQLSGALADELDKAKRYDFPKVQLPTRRKALRPDLARIVDTVWVDDMHETWLRVRKSLRVGDRRTEHGHLTRALDNARKLSYDAHRLYVTAERARSAWEADNALVNGAMWEEANKALQHEKSTGHRAKQITDGDIKAKAAVLFPDEWPAQESKRREVELTVENMKQLAREANEHVEDLRVMLAKLRSQG